MRDKIEQELEHLEKAGIITPVLFANWAAPLVPYIMMPDGSICICGDCQQTSKR